MHCGSGSSGGPRPSVAAYVAGTGPRARRTPPERASVGYPPDECYPQAIVNKVVPREKLMATCEEMAEMICDSSPLAGQAAVRLYRLTAAFPPSLVSYARDLDQIVAESEDGAEGARAFREKRKPVWKMR